MLADFAVAELLRLVVRLADLADKLLKGAKHLGRSLRRIRRRLCCSYLEYDDKISKEGTREVVQFLTLALTIFLALVAYVQSETDPVPHRGIAALYVALGVIPVVGLCYMIWGYQVVKTRVGWFPFRLIHDFGPQTIKGGAVALAFALMLCIAPPILYLYSQLPNQTRPTSLDFLKSQAIKFPASPDFDIKADDDGVAASFTFVHATYPPVLAIRIKDFDGLPAGWEVVNAMGQEWTGEKWEQYAAEDERRPIVSEVAEGGKGATVLWSGLKGGKKYRVDILLHGRKNAHLKAEVQTLIESRKVVTAEAYFTD